MCAHVKLVLPKSLLEAGLPHLLRLSVSYLDASCEDLNDVTWEQLARKLGLKAEVRRRCWGAVSHACAGTLAMRANSGVRCVCTPTRLTERHNVQQFCSARPVRRPPM